MRPDQATDMPERLAVFARFPETGRAKTRLIPVLDAEGAAFLHAEMLRHTLSRVDELLRLRRAGLEVWFTGGNLERFRHAFGDRDYRPQPDGDLGERMAAAFSAMLARSRNAVIIGTDCPDIDHHILIQAFDVLANHDLVLGPAIDGGYYLIGLREPYPELFHAMPWGTSRVLSETLERARKLGLAVHLLEPLGDVDEPGDLVVWHRVRGERSLGKDAPRVSIVIPTLNEAGWIRHTIEAAVRPGVEIIIADGDSRDDTRLIAASMGAKVISAPRGRGTQLNTGAAHARGPILLFLHADTLLPINYLDIVQEVLRDPQVALGAFRLRIDRPGILMRLVELGVRARCALFQMPYGDQALFLRVDCFRLLNGFAPIPLMEDVDLVRRARGQGSIRTAAQAVTTSGRRWDAVGVGHMTLINLACLIAFYLGVSPARLAAWRDRRTNHPQDRAGQLSHAQANPSAVLERPIAPDRTTL